MLVFQKCVAHEVFIYHTTRIASKGITGDLSMPTYSYECTKCSFNFELFHGMLEQPVVKCEKCNSACHKLIGTGAGIIFKGSGFYETDYKNKSGKKSDDSANKTKDTASESTSTDKNNGSTKNNSEKKDPKTSNPAKAAS
jgi:putative FmdB family regulatory protein